MVIKEGDNTGVEQSTLSNQDLIEWNCLETLKGNKVKDLMCKKSGWSAGAVCYSGDCMSFVITSSSLTDRA